MIAADRHRPEGFEMRGDELAIQQAEVADL